MRYRTTIFSYKQRSLTHSPEPRQTYPRWAQCQHYRTPPLCSLYPRAPVRSGTPTSTHALVERVRERTHITTHARAHERWSNKQKGTHARTHTPSRTHPLLCAAHPFLANTTSTADGRTDGRTTNRVRTTRANRHEINAEGNVCARSGTDVWRVARTHTHALTHM